MKLLITHLPLVLAVFLVGCGVKQEVHQRVVNELSEAEKAKSDLQKTLDETLKTPDAYAFSEAGKLLNSVGPRTARRAYQDFVRDFPDSTLVSSANSAIQTFEQQFEIQRKEETALEERERERLERDSRELAAKRERFERHQAEIERDRQELAAKPQNGMLTVPQLIPHLRGKSKNDVINLLGHPISVSSGENELSFRGKAYSRLLGSNDTILHVTFSGGFVYSVGLSGEQEYHVAEWK